MRILLLLVAALLAGPSAGGQTQPATAPAPRREVIIPPGFTKLNFGHRTFLLEPHDQPWVQQAAQDVLPTTRPSTMPADLLAQLKLRRESLKATMTKDLALSDGALVDNLLDETVVPMLERLDGLRPPIVYMVSTKRRLIELLKTGWSDPRFHYNRVADDVQFDASITLSVDDEGDDVVIPRLYADADSDQKKRQDLLNTVQFTERVIMEQVSLRAQMLCQAEIFGFVIKDAVVPLNLKSDQEWLGLGIAAVLSARYVTQLNGMDAQQMLLEMSTDDRRNPIRSRTIDLLHPTPPAELRREYIGPYLDAYRRRSVAVAMAWLSRAGEEAIPRMLTALRASPPPDGPALLKLIQQTTGVDLSAEVRPSH